MHAPMPERRVSDVLSRREFVASSAVGVAAAAAADIAYPMQPPRPLPPPSRWAAKPVALSSVHGLRAVQKALTCSCRAPTRSTR